MDGPHVNANRFRHAAAKINARRHHPQGEVRVRMADAQAIAILGPAMVLRIIEAQKIEAFAGQTNRQPRPRLVPCS
jgi:cytoskeletal protein CcmA (bactofilin family)